MLFGAKMTIPLVLVVDDNRRVLRSLEPPLRRRGFAPITYFCAEEAHASIREMARAPQAALIDVWLDRGNSGFDLAKSLLSHFSQTIPILMMTGYPVEQIQVRQEFEKSDLQVKQKPIDCSVLDTFLREATIASLRLSPGLSCAVGAIAGEYKLSPQQTRVLSHLAAGSKRSTLASDLGISINTLKCQIKQLLAKSCLSSTEDILAMLLRNIEEYKSSPASRQEADVPATDAGF
jgi:FixJ family two-component response regulator